MEPGWATARKGESSVNYYPHHIGDYKAATAHLSNEEDLAYRRLLEMYYDTERPIPLETQWVSRRLRVTTESIETVLADFFVKQEDGWHHARCDAEIAKWNARGWFPSTAPQLRPPIDEWKQTRLRIFARDRFRCSYCGQIGGQLECDHITPVSRGGSNSDDNLTTACKPCNRRKSNKILKQAS